MSRGPGVHEEAVSPKNDLSGIGGTGMDEDMDDDDKYDIFFKNIKGIFKGEVRLCLQQHNNPQRIRVSKSKQMGFFSPSNNSFI